ncbi:hypothetical protein [Mycobacterium sp. PS03-16]|uniref:hypothetical protein n=1 Tax=Mycobacterium sp. PS03-16 TaxID=2559611 RepID=UPI001FD86661|nr:hypothetical protein [Mycobacterium sp. PS03-16]
MSSDEETRAEKNASQPVADDPDVKMTEKPEVTDEHREIAKEMRKEYEEDRPTIVMPGTGGTVAGTAVNEWVDDDGNPKFGQDGDGGADADTSEKPETAQAGSESN